MTPEEKRVLEDEFEQQARELASSDGQNDLERRFRARLAEDPEWHNANLGGEEVLR